MTIRNRETFARATTDWSPLVPALKPECVAIDIDGSHDCNGHMLVIEAKPFPFTWGRGNEGQYGHLLHYAESTSRKGPFTVLIVYLENPGDVTSVQAAHVMVPDMCMSAFQDTQVPCKFDGLLAWLREWTCQRL